MRWLVYFVLAYITLGIQAGLGGGYLRTYGATPNLVLLAVVFIAANAPQESALLGCFVMGLMQDLLTTESLGIYALSYGLVAMFVIITKEMFHKGHPLTHFSLALAGGLITAIVLLIHSWIKGPSLSLGTLLSSALYTAILAPVVLGILQKTRKQFGFQPSRRRTRF